MPTNKVFITGSTGYIGGSVLDGIVKAYPELQISVLLRSVSEDFKSRYPQIETVKGDFDAFDTIEKSAQEAEIVLHLGDTDHIGCAKAILSGLSKRTNPSFLLHLTGTGCISDVADPEWAGKCNPGIWNDIAHINDINALPITAMHREVDGLVAAASNNLVKTFSIAPPDIHGRATGVGKRTTFMVPEYVKIVTERQEAFFLGRGENFRAVSHVSDVVSCWVLLLGEAIKDGGRAQWGREGFYFAVADEIRWKDAAEVINAIGIKQGWLPETSKTVSYSAEQVGDTMPDTPVLAKYIWGSNSRAESARLKALGWEPQGPSFWETLEDEVTLAIENRGFDTGMTR